MSSFVRAACRFCSASTSRASGVAVSGWTRSFLIMYVNQLAFVPGDQHLGHVRLEGETEVPQEQPARDVLHGQRRVVLEAQPGEQRLGEHQGVDAITVPGGQLVADHHPQPSPITP
ncbi:hypothetical protein ACIBP6_11005 [Nonomuraea terrae]|uniref:hypothetical protein n=1 Tax=Nonomuraea terrae TaxID=2530383 RepID=UPI0037970114